MMARQRMITGAEMLATYAAETDSESAYDVIEGFAAILLDSIYAANPTLALTETEELSLVAGLQDFVEDVLAPDADKLLHEWAEETRAAYEAREEGRRGNY